MFLDILLTALDLCGQTFGSYQVGGGGLFHF